MMPFKSLQASACHSQMCTLVWEWGWGANHDIDKKKAADLCVKNACSAWTQLRAGNPGALKMGNRK